MGAFLHLRRGAHGVTCSVTPLAALALTPSYQSYLLEAPDAGAVIRGPHSAGVLRERLRAIVLFVEWRYLRTGDELPPDLGQVVEQGHGGAARVGVITGTILSFEMGLLCPEFTAMSGSVFGLGFAIAGFSLLRRNDFHRHLRVRVGWPVPAASSPQRDSDGDRGVHRLADGDLGQRVDAASDRLSLSEGKVVDVDPLGALFGNSFPCNELVHMYLAGYVVVGFLVAGAYAFGLLRGRWGRHERTVCSSKA